MNPNKTGSFGAYWQNVAEYMTDRIKIPGEMGRIFETFIMVENPRAPTITVSGDSGSRVIKPGFLRPGNNDDRNNADWANTSGATNFVFDCVFAMGANALAYLGQGIQIPAFDLDTAAQTDGAATSQVQKGVAVIPVSRDVIETIN